MTRRSTRLRRTWIAAVTAVMSPAVDEDPEYWTIRLDPQPVSAEEFEVIAPPPSQLEGMEFYHGTTSIPPAYAGIEARCGMLVVWTRRWSQRVGSGVGGPFPARVPNLSHRRRPPPVASLEPDPSAGVVRVTSQSSNSAG